jgi:hypothetical protein
MPVKINCKCGVSYLVLDKKPGESIICKNCGSKNQISEHNKLKQLESEIEDSDSTICIEDNESGFEKVNLSKIVDELNEEKKIIRDKIKRETAISKGRINTSKKENVNRNIAQVVKTGLFSKQLKCLSCGDLCKMDALVCVNCGCNPKTGRTYVAPPQKTKKPFSFPIGKIIMVTFGIIILIAFLILFLIFLPKIKQNINFSDVKKELNIEQSDVDTK